MWLNQQSQKTRYLLCFIFKVEMYLQIVQNIFNLLMDEVPRSLRYIYQQNRSLHNTRLKNMKPAVDDRISPPVFKRSVDSNGYLMNNKKRNSFKKYMQAENEKMSTRILKIMSSPRREIEVQGYSKYHCVKRGFMDIKGKEIERQRSIEKSNLQLGERICKMKPDIGNMKEWNEHYLRFINDSKLVRRHPSDFNKTVVAQDADLNITRNQSNTRLEQNSDRGKELNKEKDSKSKEKLTKFGVIKSERLPYLPDLEGFSLRKKLSVIGNKNKERVENEEEETNRKSRNKVVADTTRTEQAGKK